MEKCDIKLWGDQYGKITGSRYSRVSGLGWLDHHKLGGELFLCVLGDWRHPEG